MHAKLHIDLSLGVVDVEGDLDLVREVYTDFKDKLLNEQNFLSNLKPERKAEASAVTLQKPKRKRTISKKSSTEENKSGINADSPKMDKDLDTSGLSAFYGRYEPKNNAEKILIFLKFLTDHLEIEPPNTDQVYTCYDAVNERVPKVFAQAFRDASGRKFGYIDYNSPTDLLITTKGNNHFKFDLKKKSSE